MRIKFIFISFCLIIESAVIVHAQQGPVASGGESIGTGGVASYSLGQIDYDNAQGNGGNMNQGLQQPYEIFESGAGQTGITITYELYPNPATDHVTLTIPTDMVQGMSYSLLDIQSKLIRSEKLSDEKTNISMVGLSQATYIIRLYTNSKEIKAFKLIKNY